MQSEASNISVIVRVKPLLGDGSPSLFVEENSIRLVEPATIGTQCSWVGVRDFPETRFLFRTKVAAWYTAATGQWGCGYAGDAPDAADRIGCPAHSRQADRIHSRCVMMIVIVLGISLLPIFFSARFAHSFVHLGINTILMYFVSARSPCVIIFIHCVSLSLLCRRSHARPAPRAHVRLRHRAAARVAAGRVRSRRAVCPGRPRGLQRHRVRVWVCAADSLSFVVLSSLRSFLFHVPNSFPSSCILFSLRMPWNLTETDRAAMQQANGRRQDIHDVRRLNEPGVRPSHCLLSCCTVMCFVWSVQHVFLCLSRSLNSLYLC